MSRKTEQYRKEHPEDTYANTLRARERATARQGRLLAATRNRHFWEVMGMTPAFGATYVAKMSTSLNAMLAATSEAEQSAFNTESMKYVGLSALWTIVLALIFGVLLSLVSSIIIQGFVEGKKNSLATMQLAMKNAFKDTIVFSITCFILYVFNMIGYFIAIYAGHVELSASSWYLYSLIVYLVVYIIVLFVTMIARRAPFKLYWRTISYIAIALLIAGAAGYIAVIFPSKFVVLGYVIAAIILGLIRFGLALVDKYWARKNAEAAANAVQDKKLPTDHK